LDTVRFFYSAVVWQYKERSVSQSKKNVPVAALVLAGL
jgi:hypothetical protein